MRTGIAFVLLIMLVSLSCKKTRLRPTVEPKPYFPAYPGSSWTYLDSSGHTITYRTSDDYVLHHFEVGGSGKKTKKKYVPLWDNTPVYGYEFCVKGAFGGYRLKGFVSESIGELVDSYNDKIHSMSTKTDHRISSMQVLGNTFNDVIAANNYVWQNNSEILVGINYYARDIGWIQQDYVNSSDTVTVMMLQSWSINK